MLPTPPQNCRGWSSHPAYDYSFKHSVSWPHGVSPELGAGAAGAGAGASAGAGAAAEAAAAGASAHFAHAGGPPRGPGMHYHYHGQGGFPGGYRRFGGGRRLVWFGLGIAATAWYYKHQEHKREWHAKAISDSPDPSTKHFWTNGCDNAWGHGWRRSAHEYDAKDFSLTSIPQLPHERHNSTPTGPTPVSAVSPPQDNSAVLFALQQAASVKAGEASEVVPSSPSVPSPTAPEPTDERRSWGWGERRRRLADAKREAAAAREREVQAKKAEEARAVAAASIDQASASANRDGEAEMKRLKEVVEALWNDKKMAAATAQAQANDKAKEYAREKLDKLSGVLESLRESLKTDVEKTAEKKLV